MSKDKNFKINRNKTPKPLTGSDVRIGDVFEREGSLHMRVHGILPATTNTKEAIWICNFNTGAVWQVSDQEFYTPVKDCEIGYSIK